MKLPPKIRELFARSEGDGQENKRRFSVPFSAPLAAALSLVLICAVAWAFFMGYMVGQGQNPRASINDMTGGLLNAEADPPGEKETQVFLEIPEQTPSEPAPQSPPPSPAVSPGAAASLPAAPFARPEGAQTEAWGEKPVAPARPPAKPKPAQKEKTAEPQYDYSFQVAALKSASDAEKTRQGLKAAGVRAKTQRSGKVVLVIASLRGGESDVRALRQKLAAKKLGPPLLLSKTPVRAKKAANNRDRKG